MGWLRRGLARLRAQVAHTVYATMNLQTPLGVMFGHGALGVAADALASAP